jgi:hypothetical protein
MSHDILLSTDREQLKKFAKQLGARLDSTDDIDRIKAKIAEKLGEFGFDSLAGTNASDDVKEQAKNAAIETIMSGRAELAGLSPYPTDLPKGRLPNLLPFKNPWGGRRMRLKRILEKDAQRILFIHWNGYPYVMGMEAEYADVPWPHYLVLLNARSQKLRQKKRTDDEGRAMYENTFYTVNNFPIERFGVSPGTEKLPRSLKEFIYAAYIEGFPAWTPMMWKQVASAYSYGDKQLGIVPSMPALKQQETRRLMVLDRLGLPDIGDESDDREERENNVAALLRESPIAEAA